MTRIVGEKGGNWVIMEKSLAESKKYKLKSKSVKDKLDFKSKIVFEHNGEDIHRLWILEVPKKKVVTIEIKFISYITEWSQGLHVETDGELEIDKDKGRSVRLWTDTAPPIIYLKCFSKSGKVRIWNVWSTDPMYLDLIKENKLGHSINSLVNCCGIIIKKIADNKWILNCNDGFPDDDFKDLVVEITLKEDPFCPG